MSADAAGTALHRSYLYAPGSNQRVMDKAVEEVRWARAVVQAHEEADAKGTGSITVDGEFIDAAVAARAGVVLAITERMR